MKYTYHSRLSVEQMEASNDILRQIASMSVSQYLNHIWQRILTAKDNPVLANPSNKDNNRRHEILENYSKDVLDFTPLKINKFNVDLDDKNSNQTAKAYATTILMLSNKYFTLDAIFDYALTQVLVGENAYFRIPFSEGELTDLLHIARRYNFSKFLLQNQG